jgi:hypothetical protein
MPKFTLIAEHPGAHKATHEFEVEFLPDVLDNIELFLRGVGFCPTGVLEFVEEEIYNFNPEMYDSQDVASTKSQHYFDTGRNK